MNLTADLIPLTRAQIHWNIGGPVSVYDRRDCEKGLFLNCPLRMSDGACFSDWEETATLGTLLGLAWVMAVRDRVPLESIHSEFSLIREYAECPFPRL